MTRTLRARRDPGLWTLDFGLCAANLVRFPQGMEILDLRQVRARDLESLLEEENLVWREQLRWDYTSSADLIKRFVEARALTGYAALEEGRAVGYSFFVYEEYKGLIGNLFVSRHYCGGTESQLLTHVIETMQETPGIRRIEAQLMNFGAGSLEATFRRERFQTYGRKFMMVELVKAATLEPRALLDVEVLPWNDRHFDEAASLITAAYRHHVDSEINDQYRTTAGAVRFLKNIIQFPGCGSFYGAGSLLAFHRRTGMLSGMILTSVVHPDVGHVTQVCVAPGLHGEGIGYELMRRSLEAFRADRFAGVSLTVTAANRRAVELYDRMGFQTLKEFCAYVWNASS